MWLTVTLCAIVYIIAASIAYGIFEYSDLEYDKCSGEVKEKRKTNDECPNAILAVVWPAVLVVFIIMGPFDLASWMAKKIKKMQNNKKIKFNAYKYE